MAMRVVLIHLAKALGQMLHNLGYSDRESLELFGALAAWVEKHDREK